MKELTNEIILENFKAFDGLGVFFILGAMFLLFVGLVVTIVLCITLKKEHKGRIIAFIILGFGLVSSIPLGMGFSTITKNPKVSKYDSEDILVIKSKVINKETKSKLKIYKSLGQKSTYKYYIYFDHNNESITVTKSQYNSIKKGDEYYIVINKKNPDKVLEWYSCENFVYNE